MEPPNSDDFGRDAMAPTIPAKFNQLLDNLTMLPKAKRPSIRAGIEKLNEKKTCLIDSSHCPQSKHGKFVCAPTILSGQLLVT